MGITILFEISSALHNTSSLLIELLTLWLLDHCNVNWNPRCDYQERKKNFLKYIYLWVSLNDFNNVWNTMQVHISKKHHEYLLFTSISSILLFFFFAHSAIFCFKYIDFLRILISHINTYVNWYICIYSPNNPLGF